MKPFAIHGVKRAFYASVGFTVLFLGLFGGLLAFYFVKPSKTIIAILVVTAIVIAVGVSDLFYATVGRFKRYEKMKGEVIDVRLYMKDPETGDPYDRLMAIREENGILIHKPIIGAYSKKFARNHSDGVVMKVWLAPTGELLLLEKQD
jgi:hypothetical protein